MAIQSALISNRVTSNSAEAQNLFASQRFGEKLGEKILYSLPETLFLVQKKKMEVTDFRGKKIPQKELLKKFQRIDKKFKTKYLVFKDLRKRGYIVKTALKFGAEFRVYEPGKSIGKDHAKWILFPVSESQTMTWQDFSAKNRVAHSTKKNLLIAIVDDEGDVIYYEVGWKKL
ncbi:tRNA-intron lyase [archaeon]|jgi:tRNA-intron endonuclease, archaea type|nr:tRNA-intron lyase [archaeon]MBT3577672.1 tRNA-intron lyase [archaeon]MBT6820061.1 tRNA-intron lyase [archaeon]MBT6956186.1 tRNA-intron lyase [archaeon]MBT7025337.1 tRNA-intron lyase [archaeon]